MGEDVLSVSAHLAVITATDDAPTPVDITVDIIRNELHQLLSASFPWNVRELSPIEFAVAFPSSDTLWVCTHGGMITLPVHKIKVTVLSSIVDPEASSCMVLMWVCIHGIDPKIGVGGVEL